MDLENKKLDDAKGLRVLLVDDDPVFGKIMSRIADQHGFRLTYCQRMVDFQANRHKKFDVAIIDYDLEFSDGLTFIRDLEKYAGLLDVVLISSQPEIEGLRKKRPSSIKAFVKKSSGYKSILASAIACYQKRKVRTL